tara:strand:- start:263 stop:1201 length:939 start_codon:yes stop_codon:yes gene_type:complete
MIPKCLKKIRKNVDYPFGELIFPLVLIISQTISGNIDSSNLGGIVEQLIDSKKLRCKNPEKYLQDFESRPESSKNDYITKCRIELNEFDFGSEIKQVTICGKSSKDYPELAELVKDLPRSQKTKADIFIKLNNDKIIGLSIKNSKKATKMNRSVHAVLGKENGNHLSDIKKDFIYEKLGIDNIKDKSKRNQINSIFRPGIKNNYWDELKRLIEELKERVKKDLYDTLYGTNTPFEMYEFDGEILKKVEPDCEIDDIRFEEHEPFYFTKTKKMRKAAKLFYLFETPKEKFRVEIRHKGDFAVSPQFQFHQIKK